ncbi:hypothetical protein Rhow_001114 [Rhodococcus wratislaviensis]|uniref:Uncharacterized protein n=1 Tax=Rhodococcus wratislaviensis TaxID=44752 RepID=A0A402CN86_RHOWR|nr:hypothetical protein Rhow_001114 [Rhodococcus wratislaviensis]
MHSISIVFDTSAEAVNFEVVQRFLAAIGEFRAPLLFAV